MNKSPRKSSQSNIPRVIGGVNGIGKGIKSKSRLFQMNNKNKNNNQKKSISTTTSRSRGVSDTLQFNLRPSQTRHSDPLPKSALNNNTKSYNNNNSKQPKRRSLPQIAQTVRFPITNQRVNGGIFKKSNLGLTSDEGTELEDEVQGGRGGIDGDNEDSSQDSSTEYDSDSSAESDVEFQKDDYGFEVVDPAFVNKKLRQLKKGALMHKHSQDEQEINEAFETCAIRSKELFIGFLGTEVTQELLKGIEEIELLLAAGVRLYEQKKVKHLNKTAKDSEKIDQTILKLAEQTKKVFSRRQLLAGNIQASREAMVEELKVHKQTFEAGIQALKNSKSTKAGGGNNGKRTSNGTSKGGKK